VETCSILTTTPNAVTAVVSDRMPVILDLDLYDLWLDPGMKDAGFVSELLKAFHARIMPSYPVSTRVNQAVNDDEECSAHPCNRSRLRVHCASRLGCSSYSFCKSSFIIKRAVMAALLSARLN
jgi:hypothetical protein